MDHWDLDHPFERLLVETAIAPDPKEVAWINPKIKPGERRKVGYPIAFAVNGKQYVSVATGPSGVANSTLRVTRELKPSTTGQLLVFALP